MKCLLVEDDKYQSLRLKGLLKAHEVRECGTLCEAKSFLSSYSYDIAFIDLDLNGNLEGLELVKIAKENKRKYIYGGSRLSGYHQQKCSIE
jgi:two-component SAPR family response regulator